MRSLRKILRRKETSLIRISGEILQQSFIFPLFAFRILSDEYRLGNDFDQDLEDSIVIDTELDQARQIGVNIQEKSKKKLNDIRARVGQTHQLADMNLEELERQKEQILRIQDHTQKLDTTLNRTKKYVKYFSKSFCRDPVTLTLIFLIRNFCIF